MAKGSFTNPQEAEQAFYEAFQRADLDAMMAVWAEDEEVYCVHPGGPRLTGIESIRESFRQIFANGPAMRFELRAGQTMQGGLIAVSSVYEHITVLGERRQQASVAVATNVYVNVGGGWRMVGHHGSPASQAEARPAAARPSSPGLLH
jgi:uncharacterized protein (TIGR02246 family)